VYGESYASASTTLVILGIGWLAAIASGPVDNVLLMAGKSWYTTVNIGIASAFNVALNAILIPSYGMEGAGTAWAISLVLNNALPLVQVRRILGFTPFGPMLARTMVPVAGFAAMLLGARLALGETLPALLVGSLAGGGALVCLAGRDRRALRLDDLWAGIRRRGAAPLATPPFIAESAG
jgi:O-antigen/teichoic acid export membrane protein